MNTAQTKPVHSLTLQPRERSQFPKRLIPDTYFESYKSFSLLCCRDLHACMSGSSRLLFKNTRAASQIPEELSLPQQLSFKLCSQTSLKASSAHRTNSLGSVSFWRRWEQITSSPQLCLCWQREAVTYPKGSPAEDGTRLELHT